MTSILKSKLFAAVLAFAVAMPLTVAGSAAFAPPAEAGIVSSVKSAAKKVGGAVKTTAKGIGAAAKAGAAAGKQVGVGVGGTIKRGAVAAGKGIAKYTPVGSVVKSVKVVVNNVRKVAIAAEKKHFNFRYKSPRHKLEIFRTFYGPVLKTFQAIAPTERASLEADILALMDEFNVAEDGTLVIPSEYLEAVITRKR